MQDYYNSDELMHYGRKGMKWGQNIFTNKNLKSAKSIAEQGSTISGRMKGMADKSIKNQKRVKMDLSSMSDQELRSEINRALLERQYNDMFAPQKVSRGKEIVSKTLDVAGDVLAIGGSALGIALAIKNWK